MDHRKPRNNIAKALQELSTSTLYHGLIREVANDYGVSENNLSRAWAKLVRARADSDVENLPIRLARAARLVDPRGSSSNRLLTDKEEAEVVRRLKSEHPNGFTDRVVRQTCIDVAVNLRNHPHKWSPHFLRGFKRRAGISRAKFVLRKRNVADPAKTFELDVDAAIRFIDTVEKATQTCPIERIINVDETPSYVRNAPSHALHFIDSPLPWAWTRAQEREKVTVIAACAGDGSMLKSAVIAKGSTSRCEAAYVKEIGDLAYIQHTASGLTNTDSFIVYIHNVIIPYTNNSPSALIVDSWGAHLTQPVRDFCKAHNIQLIRVPDRGTTMLQPLDVGVFGVAKTVIYSNAKESYFELIRPEEDRWFATSKCVEALRDTNCATVQRSWMLTFPFWKDLLISNNMLLQEQID
jgi:DDE superfamily endonuclease